MSINNYNYLNDSIQESVNEDIIDIELGKGMFRDNNSQPTVQVAPRETAIAYGGSGTTGNTSPLLIMNQKHNTQKPAMPFNIMK